MSVTGKKISTAYARPRSPDTHRELCQPSVALPLPTQPDRQTGYELLLCIRAPTELCWRGSVNNFMQERTDVTRLKKTTSF